ncbi:hypothetical protein M409DRAFT_66343 [Zasmidium cellare ATCC 36951]|uniref:Major facilitator superfamily (MFS) profile domain-containing protein n=1 Tax=Zasmidium cellare ATCC 36951 TaxID=1080233 RepID=A0A6A6CHM2_ZASCE|nr:uncharacterized protein M409DRAFT_66343 [Zasmidium cellare ATCC 36951]KAF2166757.1 hypothetical protein M409DRAFT_66343 [Zasmidium cellare ATCC 36951]
MPFPTHHHQHNHSTASSINNHPHPLRSHISTQEGFGDGARVGGGGGEVPVRPPLRPMVSFGEISMVSYYSMDEPILEKESNGSRGGSDWRFYGCFACLALLNFVCDVSFTALATALPTISQDLSLTAVQTLWITGSLLLSAAIAQPLFMRLPAALGCKAILLFGIAVYITGSILAACAEDATSIIAARSIEGFGVGAIMVLTQLTLNQIGRAACSAPALIALPFLLRLPYVEAGSIWRRLLKVDILGWLLLSGSLVSIAFAVSLGGTAHAWNSFNILVPLIAGMICLPLWCIYNRYRIEAILPVSIFNNASAAAACFGAFAHGAILAAIIYLVPIFLQLQGLNELVSGVSLAPWTFSIVAFGLLGGAVQSLSGYRWAIWTGWGFATLGVGLMILFKESTSATFCAPIGLIGGIALGLLLPSQTTAIESAASTDDETIHAAPLHIYLTTLGQCFGVLGGSSIFLNKLKNDMLGNSYPSSNALNYTKHAFFMTGLRSNLIASYTSSLRPVWITACAIAGLAFFLSFWFLEDHTPSRRPSLPELE